MAEIVTTAIRGIEHKNQVTPLKSDDFGAKLLDVVTVEKLQQKIQKLRMKLLSEQKAKEAWFGMFFVMLGLLVAFFLFIILKCIGS